MQILEEPERLHEAASPETIVVVQWFCRRCWALGARYEVAVSGNSFKPAAAKLASQVRLVPRC